MKIHFLVCILCNLFFATLLAENPQSLFSLLFNRDSVESVAEHSSSENVKKPIFMSLEEYGSKSLPLRTAVESVPDLTQNSQRLPLRDAVEKRPLPQDLLQRQIYQPFLSSASSSSSSQFIDPYRITNYYQQLILSPFSFTHHQQLQQARNLELAHSNEEKKIVCYFEAAAVYRKPPLTFTAEDLDANLCTHLIYAYASLNTQDFKVTSNDEEYDVIQGGFKSVVALKQFNRNLKVLLAIGGPREDASHKFSRMVKNSQTRKNFIESALNITKFFEFDGIEIHWEYPEQNDKENFQHLLDEISEIFKKSELILALVGPKNNIEDGFYVSKLNDIVDFVNIQTYDYHKEKSNPEADHHAPLFSRSEDETGILNADYSIKSWIKGGLNRNKIILGIPFFGRSFTLQYLNNTQIGASILGPGKEGFYTQKPGFLAYFEICDMLVNEGWFKNEDSNGSPFITNGNQWVAYEDASTIKTKANYIRNNNLGGASVYAVDLDDFKALCGEKWSLLSALYKNLNNRENVPFLETNSENSAVKPYGTCKSEGYYSDPKNCASYYICKNGLSYHLSCGDNKMFDSTNGKCTRQIRNCRPGEMIYVHQNLKKLNQELFRDNTHQDDDELKVVCYVTNWAFYRKADGKFVPENIDQRLCTHIVYAFASLDAETLQIKEFDNWADIDNNLYERVTSLKDSKVLLSLGGWTDSTGDKYSKLVSDGSARRRFVVGIISFLRRHGFRGLHFDWNYPICWQSNCKKGPASDKPNFSKLIQELEKEFSKQSPPLILAASIAGYKEVIDVAYDLSALGQSLDFISVMTYDYHGAWEGRTGHVSPLYSKPDDKYPQYSTNFTMEYLVSKGAPREKLLVGIPFYGQTFSLTKSDSFIEGTSSNGPGEAGEYTKQPGMLSYYEICYRIKNHNWILNKGKFGSGPYAYLKNQWVGFEDIESVKEKANYIRTAGFGGVVAWTIDLDDFTNKCCSGSFPLLRSLNHALGRINSAPDLDGADCSKPPAPSTPSPPETTTGVDSGSVTSEHHHTEWTTQKTSTNTWWSTEKSSTTTQSSWWSSSTSITHHQPSTKKPPTTIPWWQPSTTKKPTTAEESSTIIPPPAVIKPSERPSSMDGDGSSISKSCEPGQYLPDPNNCNAFYRCVGGELSRHYCAGGLHWNRNKRICDWPASAKCKNFYYAATTTTTTRPSTQNAIFTTPTTTNNNNNNKGCESGTYYPHEECNQYYVCVNNHLMNQNCPPGLNWDVSRGMCDWKFKVKCSGRRKIAQKYTLLHLKGLPKRARPYSKCQENIFAPYPGDCTQYMQCLWGKYEVFRCGPGLFWNSEMNICDWPKGSHCTEESDVDDVDENEIDLENSSSDLPSTLKPSTSTTPVSTTDHHQWEWKPPPSPPSTSDNEPNDGGENNSWEWHPPIPPTSEKPPLSEPLKPKSDYFKIVCYFTNWAWYRQGQGKYLPEDIDENLCTHIVYGFAVLDFSNLIIKAHDSWADFDNQFYKRVIEYKSKGMKVSIAIGGWNDSQGDKYSRLVNNPEARRRFIEHIVKFLDKWNFDGLDLDWEYPKCWQVDCKKGPDSDKAAFGAFVKELKAAFKPKGYLLSSAVSPSKTVIDAGYDVPLLGEYLDWIAVMTYDFHGQWDKQTGHVAPLFHHPQDEVPWFNSNFTIHYWIAEGVPRRKIVMGMPLYGQSFRLENEKENGLNAKAPGPGEAGEYTKAAGFLAYYEICDNIQNKGWKVVQDPKRRVGPYAFKGNQWVSFDDREMIRIKSEYIRRMDLGGGMIWALDLDDFKNKCGDGRHPLLTTIRNVLAETGTGVPEPIPPIIIDNEDLLLPIEAVELEEEIDDSSSPIVNRNSEFKVICYFTNWAWYRQGRGKFLPEDIDPNLCSHIIYGFAVLNRDELIIKPHDSWADFDNRFYEKVTALKAKGIKILIAIGGWNDSAGDKYSRLVNNPAARRKFVAHVADFIETNNFDGLDLDWEYPKCWQVDCGKGPVTDKPAFAELVKELHEAFQPKGWLLSAAVSPSKKVIDSAYNVKILSKYLDWIAVMTYDYHGQWDKITGHVAPMYTHPEDIDATFNTNFTINYWIQEGADRKKLIMGMPMYGQSFSLADNKENGLNAATYGGGEAGEDTRARGFLAYYEICTNILKKEWKLVRDKQGRIGPYAYLRDQWVSFDDIGMIRHKSEYIKAMGLGGGMIWALDLDDFKNECQCEAYPLLRTINRVLRDYAVPDPKCILGKITQQNNKPSTEEPMSSTTDNVASSSSSTVQQQQEEIPTYPLNSCSGNQFLANSNNCNEYYLCNQGFFTLQACPTGLFWNKNHCDWPENTACHPDSTTTTTTSSLSINSY